MVLPQILTDQALIQRDLSILQTEIEPYLYPVNLIKSLERHAPAFAAVLVGILYFFTIAPTISHTDSGELTAVCYNFGVAHPTGYPLYTLLGGLFTHLPLGSPAFNLNLMALLFTAGAVWIWGKTLKLMFDAWRVKVPETDLKLTARVRWAGICMVLAGCLGLGTGLTWWSQSTSGEVYSLHAFLLGLSLFLLMRAFTGIDRERKPWIFFACSLALLFANHLTAIVFLPGIAWLYFRKWGIGKTAWTTLGLMIAAALPLLVLQYLWLPVRASSDGVLAWGNPQGWEEIWHHISGKQFSVWMFTGAKAFNANLSAFFERLPWEMGVLLLLAVPGMVYLFRFQRDWAVFFVINILANVLWACNYAIKDLEPYFLLALISLSGLGAVGMRWIWLRMKGSDSLRSGLSGLVLAGIVFVGGWNYSKVDQRGAWQYEDYARAGLQSLPPNSILISQAWDVLVSPSYYVQHVEGIRKDVTVLDFPMLQNRHWYPDHVRRVDPALAKALGTKLTRWEETVRDFDLRGKTDIQALSQRFQEVLWGIFGEYKNRPVFLSPELKDMAVNPGGGLPVPPGMTLVPEHYFYRLLPLEESKEFVSSPLTMYPFRMNADFGNPEDKLLLGLLRDILSTRIRYAQAFGKMNDAAALEKLLEGLPKI